ncbi:MAG: MASE3 domain-containing protein [Bacillota bacterium]|nr:MASE3 domain-containing protein [Bacillota bacterium]
MSRRAWASLVLYLTWGALAWLLFPFLSQPLLSPTWWLPVHNLIAALVVMICSASAFNLFVWLDYAPTFTHWLGPTLLAVGVLEFLHAVSLPASAGGSPLFSPEANLWFWIAARAITGLAFLIDALLLVSESWPRAPSRRLRLGLLAGTLLVAILVLYAHWSFPALRSPQRLPTAAKYVYVLIPTFLTAAASLLISAQRKRPPEAHVRYFTAGLDLLVLSQFFLLPSTSTYDLYSLVSHLLKLGAYGCLFAALVFSTVLKPYRQLQGLMNSCLSSLTEAIDAHDPYTRGHSSRVKAYAEAIGRALRLSEEELKHLRLAALLHDIGKINIPDRILAKKKPLTEKEWETIRQHPQHSARIVDPLGLPEVIRAVLDHHERLDGRGYPSGKREKEIDLLGRIIAVADTYDAITSDRPYRKKRSPEEALQEIQRVAGTQLDPRCVQALLEAYRRYREVFVEQ